MPLSKVIIVGAGPSGLLLALLLAKAGINVELLEQTDELDKNPRASHYTAESCYEFDRAGILDQIEAEGFFPNGVSWRRLDENKTRLLMVRNPEPAPGQENDPAFKYRMICLPLHRLGKILEKAVLDQPSASIRFGYKVVEIGQDESAAWVKAETSDGTETRSADYIVGCDGANSIIRRRLFGDWEFPGFTWDKQIVATNVSPSTRSMHMVVVVVSQLTVRITDVLRLLSLRLRRLAILRPPRTLAHGSQDSRRWPVSRDIRRAGRPDIRRDEDKTTRQVSGLPPRESHARQIQARRI